MKRIISSTTLGIFVSLLSIAPTAVDSHGVEVRHCITPDGNNIRIFVEHWHFYIVAGINDPEDAGEMDITDNVAGTSALYNATGLITGVLPGNLWMDGRCRENFSTMVSKCTSPPLSINKTETNDWVYYDFPFTCDVLSSYTINAGLTDVLRDGCKSEEFPLYPAYVSDIFACGTASPSLSGTRVPTLSPTITNSPSITLSPTIEQCIEKPFLSETCASRRGRCVINCEPFKYHCYPDLCAAKPSIPPGDGDISCTCAVSKKYPPVETDSPSNAPTHGGVGTNQPTCPPAGNYPLIAGHNPRTNATQCLGWDLIQQELEDIMQYESCARLGDGENFYFNGAGTYFQNIPSYTSNEATVYSEFTKYYGKDDFLQIWIKKAFYKRKTNFNRGNADFTFGNVFPGSYGLKDGECVGYVEAIEKATAYTGQLVNSYQYVQKAIDLVRDGCYAQDDNCNDAIEAIDCAVAAYVGSLEGTHGNNDPAGDYGKGPYGLADMMCPTYHNCGPNRDSVLKDDTSPVNAQIMSLFAALSSAAWVGDARLLEFYLRLLSNKSIIPLIQGIYKSYYYLDSDNQQYQNFPVDFRSPTLVGRGAGYMLSALPKLWACSAKGAQKAYEQTKLGSGGPAGNSAVNFEDIRLAFECNYRCLGIRCEEVGSLHHTNLLYHSFSDPIIAEACDDRQNGSQNICDKSRGQRKNACKIFTGKAGIKGRDKDIRDYFTF